MESITITFDVEHTLSNSKGWARYKASTTAGKLISSRTGNEWVSSHAGAQIATGECGWVLTQAAALANCKAKVNRR